MKILEPTMILGSAQLTVNAAGGTTEMDFDFGNLEGALLLGVDYHLEAIGASGQVNAGLNLDPDAAAPTTNIALMGNNLVIGHIQLDEILSTNGASALIIGHRDLRHLDIVIARNIALQAYGVDANNRGAMAKVYYKRVAFSVNEVGPIITFRR